MRGLLLLLALGTLPLLATAQPATAVVGRWQPANEQGTLEIYEQQGRFFGRVVGPTAPRRLDANNSDPALRGRELLGAVILQGFRYKGRDTWRGGTIYDPISGHTYTATLRLRDANTLVVRGYVGLPLLGRTVVWTRQP